jgi:hypothetical protein
MALEVVGGRPRHMAAAQRFVRMRRGHQGILQAKGCPELALQFDMQHRHGMDVDLDDALFACSADQTLHLLA